MLLLLAEPALLHDLPVCFPGRPCKEFTPVGADIINLTSALTPASGAIEIGYLVLIAVALLVMAAGLLPRPSRPGPSPWLIAWGVALIVLGNAATTAVNSRFGAITLIYGPDPGAIGPLVGSWPEVGLAGGATIVLGIAGLAAVGLIATLRLRRVSRQVAEVPTG